MKISIITICYNPGLELQTAIDSLISQRYPDIEYIIIDGGSTDGTIELIEQKYSNNVDIFISEPDKGLYDALNKGVDKANGDIIGIVHADDMFAGPDVLEKVVKNFKKSKCDGVYGDLLYVNKNTPDSIIRHWKSGDYKLSKLRYGWMPPHPALFLSKEAYKNAKLPNGEYYDTNLKIAADYDFMMRILNKNKISLSYIPEVLVKMRAGGTSNRSIGNIIRKSKEDLKAIRRNQVGGLLTLIFKNLRKIPQFIGKSVR